MTLFPIGNAEPVPLKVCVTPVWETRYIVAAWKPGTVGYWRLWGDDHGNPFLFVEQAQRFADNLADCWHCRRAFKVALGEETPT